MLKRLVPLAVSALAVGAQEPARGNPAPTRVPFAAGERLEYSVSYGRLHVGSGQMTVHGVDTIGGHAVWHAELAVSGGIPLFRVNDTTASWFDVGTLVSRRFIQHVHEGRYNAIREFAIDPAARRYVKNDEPVEESSADPLDDVSMLYFVRTLPLKDGDRYEFRRYFRPEGNPVVVRVVGRERVTVPAGEFSAVVVEPQITTTGIFSQNGHARLWFSDDSARVLLQMKSGLRFGSINLYLTRIVSR